MKNETISKIVRTMIYAFMMGLSLWYVNMLQNELAFTHDMLLKSMDVLDEAQEAISLQSEVITITKETLELTEEALNDVTEDLENYQTKLMNSNAELERVEQENAELKKSIADLHARAQRTSANGASITESDKILLAQLVYSEARGESTKGQQAVVDVVLNRLADDRFPDTVREVIMQPGQFDEAHILHTYPATDTILDVVDDALTGTDVTNGAIFFFNPYTAGCGWQWSRTPTAQIGPHRFSR